MRQPLQRLEVSAADFETLPQLKELLDIIADEINVKNVTVSQGINSGEVSLDLHLTDELKREGMYRELVRAIQGARKTAGLKPGEVVSVVVHGNDEVNSVIRENEPELITVCSLSNIRYEKDDGLSVSIT